jgi:hypothetical protein
MFEKQLSGDVVKCALNVVPVYCIFQNTRPA